MNKTATLISRFHTIYYISGFESLSPTEREAVLVVIDGVNYIITDARYKGYNSPRYELIIMEPGDEIFTTVHKLCKKHEVATIIYESDNLTEHEVALLNKQNLQTKGELRLYASNRSVKTNEEIGYIREACRIGDMALARLIPGLRVGQTEKEIAWKLEKIIREELLAELAFDPIIAVDANAAMPHYNTKKGNGTIHDSSLILIDFGVRLNNYCSDITRMAIAKKGKSQIMSAYQQLVDAQEHAVSAVASCKQLSEVDRACRNKLIVNGHPSFPHSTGHGIGLEVHELPRVHTKSTDIKQIGQVFTIEPGIYYEGRWGMRLEDTVVVTPQGSAELLTQFPKELIHLR